MIKKLSLFTFIYVNITKFFKNDLKDRWGKLDLVFLNGFDEVFASLNNSELSFDFKEINEYLISFTDGSLVDIKLIEKFDSKPFSLENFFKIIYCILNTEEYKKDFLNTNDKNFVVEISGEIFVFIVRKNGPNLIFNKKLYGNNIIYPGSSFFYEK